MKKKKGWRWYWWSPCVGPGDSEVCPDNAGLCVDTLRTVCGFGGCWPEQPFPWSISLFFCSFIRSFFLFILPTHAIKTHSCRSLILARNPLCVFWEKFLSKNNSYFRNHQLFFLPCFKPFYSWRFGNWWKKKKWRKSALFYAEGVSEEGYFLMTDIWFEKTFLFIPADDTLSHRI